MKSAIFFLLGLIVSVLFLACNKTKDYDQESYSFFVAGHTYGKPGRVEPGIFPPFIDQFGLIKSEKDLSLVF